MRLEQKIYEFKKLDGLNLKKQNILLTINEVPTEMSLKDLFVGEPHFYLDWSNEVKGWSILEKIYPSMEVTNETGTLKIGFKSEELESSLELVDIKNPFIQLDDKDIDDEKLNGFKSKLFELHAQIIREASEPVSSRSGEEDLVEIVNESYEKDKMRLVSNGFKEYVFENYRLLIKGKYILFVILVDGSNYEKSNELVKIEDDFYQLNSIDGLTVYNIKLIDDKLSVNIIGGSEKEEEEPEAIVEEKTEEDK